MRRAILVLAMLTAIFGLFAQSLYINEIQAKNESTITDPEGDYCDWVEIYNADDSSVDLGGMYLADDHYDGTLESCFMISDEYPEQTTLVAGGFMLFWFDEDTDDGIFHVDTKLGGSADAVYLISSENVVIDSYEYEYEENTGLDVDDVSIGRVPDGTDNWSFFGPGYSYPPSPGSSDNMIANDEETIPSAQAALNANYPNPFNPETTISFTLPQQANASLTVFNIRGQKVKSLFNGQAQQGTTSVVWKGTDDTGKSVSSGIYYYRLQTSNQVQTRKMVLMK